MLSLHERSLIAHALRLAAAQTDHSRRHMADVDATIASNNELEMLKLSDDQRAMALAFDDDGAVVTIIPGRKLK